MGNSLTGIKKFLSNKNTVTFVCVILGVLVLYFGYSWRVNQATSPIRVPYAKKTLAKKTKITPDLIGYTNIPQSLKNTSKDAFLTNENEIGFNILSNFMQLFGGIFGVIICYVLPVIIYIGAHGRRKVKSIIGFILTGIFLFVGIVSVCHSVYGIFHKNDYLN